MMSRSLRFVLFPCFLFHGYDCSREETTAIASKDVQNRQHCTYSALDRLDIFDKKGIKLISEEWNMNGQVIAFRDYPNASESDNNTVVRLSRGIITLVYGMSLNYSVLYEDTNTKSAEESMVFSGEMCRRGDVPGRWIIPVSVLIPLAGIAAAIGVGVYCWWRRRKRNRSRRYTAVERAVDQNPQEDHDQEQNPQEDQDQEQNPQEDQHMV
ncbi:uncharacterized protein LOC118216008 isoform X2 [Anguilla anguilla]|uniref:uncharacterized protein LOC118216008 isoform X2 n=1 Tax=Anguilla anguilla TaxID=7936 RepID=UPI0015B30DB6|nr:uncharacterized protein LOC118216008 isoform X2 [Anguilla anguilla]